MLQHTATAGKYCHCRNPHPVTRTGKPGLQDEGSRPDLGATDPYGPELYETRAELPIQLSIQLPASSTRAKTSL